MATTRPGLQPQPKTLNILQALRRYWMLSVVVLVALGATGVYLAKKRDTLVYSSFSEIHVSRTYQRTLQNDREMDLRNTQEYDIFRNEQIGILLRPDVLKDALVRCGQLENGTWAPAEFGHDASIGVFRDSIDAYLLDRSYRIAVDIIGYNPYALQEALDSLLEAFLDAHNLEYSLSQDERPEVLRKAMAELETAIGEKRGRLQTLAEELNVLNFRETRTNPWLTPLENARLAKVEAERNEKDLRAQVEAADNAESSPIELDTVLLGGAASAGPGLESLVGPLVERRSELLSRLLDMGPSHPARADLESKVVNLEEQIEDLLQRHAEVLKSQKREELRKATALIGQLESEVQDLESRAKTFVTSFQEGMVLEASLDEDVTKRLQIKERLSFFEIEGQSPSYVRVAMPASQVDMRGSSNLTRNYGIVAMLSLLAALALPILLEVRDHRIHTTKDVQEVLGFPPAIWIPERKKDSQKLLAADQVRRFALALDRDQAYARSRLILFTEVKDGKNYQLMIEDIAQALSGFGRKVLVVDASAPRGRRAPDAYSTPGFLGLLAGKGLQVLSRDGWDFLEYGNPLLESGHSLSGWNGILRAAAQDYDMVLIKAGPVLVSPDSEHMASSADLVVLVVEAEKQTRGEVHRAGDVLAAIQPASVGSILNNAKVFSGHGYYRELVKDRKALPAGNS